MHPVSCGTLMPFTMILGMVMPKFHSLCDLWELDADGNSNGNANGVVRVMAIHP